MPDQLRPDPDQVRGMWRALSRPGEVREVRIPKARKGARGWYSENTIAGWFDNEDAFVRAICGSPASSNGAARHSPIPPITGHDASAVYLTLNPVKADLLARRANRLDRSSESDLTGDKDIARRTVLLIDCDAERVAGISATDSELTAALTSRAQIR